MAYFLLFQKVDLRSLAFHVKLPQLVYCGIIYYLIPTLGKIGLFVMKRNLTKIIKSEE